MSPIGGLPQITAGAGEHGADIVMEIAIPFFEDSKIVVQVKHRVSGVIDNDPTSIEQLRTAFIYYNAIAGLLITSAEQLGPLLLEPIEKLKSERRQIAVLYGRDLYRRVLQMLPSTYV